MAKNNKVVNPNVAYRRFIKRIKAATSKYGTKAPLCRKAGINQVYLNRVLRGEQILGFQKALQISYALEIPLEELIN